MNLNAIHMNNPSDDTTAGKASTESPAAVTSTGGKSIKIRDALVALLTFGVGSVDALSFLTLGGVFASFMSGNTVTGTWTSFIIGLVTLRRSPSLRTVKQEQSTALQAVTLLVYVLGAATGGLAGTYFLLKAAIILVLAIGLVLLVASTRMR